MTPSTITVRRRRDARGIVTTEQVVVLEQEVEAWGAQVPDLPGCVPVGERLEEVEQLIAEAIPPQGLGFVAHGDGTAIIAGTPRLFALGDYPIAVTASNAVGGSATQTLHVVVDLAPVLFAPSRATLVVGRPRTTAVAATQLA